MQAFETEFAPTVLKLSSDLCKDSMTLCKVHDDVDGADHYDHDDDDVRDSLWVERDGGQCCVRNGNI